MAYAIDGVCHNSEPGTYGHECGKPAVWNCETPNGHRSAFCDDCRHHGYERHQVGGWQPFNRNWEIAIAINRNHVDEHGHVDEGAMVKVFEQWNVAADDRRTIWRALTNRETDVPRDERCRAVT